MVTAYWQDEKFAKDLLDPDTLLEAAIKWICDNLEPEDVFTEKQLDEWAEVWAENNGYEKQSD